MDRPNVGSCAVAGARASIRSEWGSLDAVADVLVVQSDGALGPVRQPSCSPEADLLGTTNLCLPRLDAELLSRLPRLQG